MDASVLPSIVSGTSTPVQMIARRRVIPASRAARRTARVPPTRMTRRVAAWGTGVPRLTRIWLDAEAGAASTSECRASSEYIVDTPWGRR